MHILFHNSASLISVCSPGVTAHHTDSPGDTFVQNIVAQTGPDPVQCVDGPGVQHGHVSAGHTGLVSVGVHSQPHLVLSSLVPFVCLPLPCPTSRCKVCI